MVQIKEITAIFLVPKMWNYSSTMSSPRQTVLSQRPLRHPRIAAPL